MRPVYIQASVCGNDIVIVESDEWELQWAVIEWANDCKERGMEISECKSKTMHTKQGIKRRLKNV
jgi:uncharacterized protein YjaG (DUF416 family)